MKKPLFSQFTSKLKKQYSDFSRHVRRRKAALERTQREKEVINLARSQRAARAQSARIRSARRGAAQQLADVQQAVRWTTFQQSARRAVQQTFKKTQHMARNVRTMSPALRRLGFRLVLGVAVFSVLANIVLYYRYSGSRALVTVGNRAISKNEFLKDVQDAAGKAVLNKVVFAELIGQAAAKAGANPSEQDITARLAEIRRRKPGSVPADDTPTLRAEVGQILALENLRIQGVTASDDEIAAFYAAHKADFTLPPQAQASLVVAGNAADASQGAQMLAQDMPEAAIASHRGLHVAGINGFQVNMASLPPAVRDQLTAAVMGMKTGEIKSFTLGKTFLIFKMKNHDPGAVLPLSQVKDQVARLVKLQKAPSEQAQLLALYKTNKPVFDMANYKDYFADIENAAAPAKPGDAPKTASLP